MCVCVCLNVCVLVARVRVCRGRRRLFGEAPDALPRTAGQAFVAEEEVHTRATL